MLISANAHVSISPYNCQVESDALAGADIVNLSVDVDFGVGDKLIITASEVGAGMTQTEEIEVLEVLSPRSLRLTKPLVHNHRSAW